MARPETIYNAEKIARFLGVTKATVRDWCKHGKLPGFKIGKEWKVRVADLQRTIARKVRVDQNGKGSAGQRLF